LPGAINCLASDEILTAFSPGCSPTKPHPHAQSGLAI
jgi:hypothetical protein